MTYWMCVVCGSCFTASGPPAECPHCREKCSFRDVTCYRPDCGGEENPDSLLVSEIIRNLERCRRVDY